MGRDDNMKRKRGRPKSEKSMRNQFHMSMSSEMVNRLNNLSKITGMTRADIFREAFDGYEKLKLIQSIRGNSVDNDDDGYEYYDEYDDFDDGM